MNMSRFLHHLFIICNRLLALPSSLWAVQLKLPPESRGESTKTEFPFSCHSRISTNLTQLANWMFHLQLSAQKTQWRSLVCSRPLRAALPPSERLSAPVCACETNPSSQTNDFMCLCSLETDSLWGKTSPRFIFYWVDLFCSFVLVTLKGLLHI